MKIVYKAKKNKKMLFSNVPYGSIFKSNGAYATGTPYLFMKVNYEGRRNAIDIEKTPGKNWSFEENEYVELVNCELHIND